MAPTERSLRQVAALAALLVVAAAALPRAAAATHAELLLEMKASFANGDSVLASWEGDNPCSGTWLGIGCDASGHVTSIDLSGKGIQGSIPATTGWILPETLTRLALNDNALSGPIPSGWELPASLESLELGGAGLSGALPASWTLPSGLQHLQLCCNALSGTLPASWVLPEGMNELDLDNNAFSGTIPNNWHVPPSMWILNLHHNVLTGTVPRWSNLNKTNIALHPGNPGLCGEVPEGGPKYGSWKAGTIPYPTTTLPPCAKAFGTSTNALFIWGGVLVAVVYFVRKVTQKSLKRPAVRRSVGRWLRNPKP